MQYVKELQEKTGNKKVDSKQLKSFVSDLMR
jgi:hypothetical protein